MMAPFFSESSRRWRICATSPSPNSPRPGLGDQGQRIARQLPDSPAGFSAGDVDNADLVAWLDENGELVERRGDTLRLDWSSAGAEK